MEPNRMEADGLAELVLFPSLLPLETTVVTTVELEFSLSEDLVDLPPFELSPLFLVVVELELVMPVELLDLLGFIVVEFDELAVLFAEDIVELIEEVTFDEISVTLAGPEFVTLNGSLGR
ncbi:7795_t:CDS:2 [Ambispora gerdemannii]|uniref:7795_t:CDS:1 n=1 Tax=Ambispora gerdemannii TaxID=144530 RepID=A0A9N8ZMV8_9GLOM|nr:7795_t:CDS:2 [Ambispora gerdemannii]